METRPWLMAAKASTLSSAFLVPWPVASAPPALCPADHETGMTIISAESSGSATEISPTAITGLRVRELAGSPGRGNKHTPLFSVTPKRVGRYLGRMRIGSQSGTARGLCLYATWDLICITQTTCNSVRHQHTCGYCRMGSAVSGSQVGTPPAAGGSLSWTCPTFPEGRWRRMGSQVPTLLDRSRVLINDGETQGAVGTIVARASPR